MSTSSTQMHEWADQPAPGRSANDWPYPTRYSTSLISGDLADLIRAKLGVDAHVPVIITEKAVSGGYSEYTQETDYHHTITVGEHAIQLEPSWARNGITALTDWLDGTDAA